MHKCKSSSLLRSKTLCTRADREKGRHIGGNMQAWFSLVEVPDYNASPFAASRGSHCKWRGKSMELMRTDVLIDERWKLWSCGEWKEEALADEINGSDGWRERALVDRRKKLWWMDGRIARTGEGMPFIRLEPSRLCGPGYDSLIQCLDRLWFTHSNHASPHWGSALLFVFRYKEHDSRGFLQTTGPFMRRIFYSKWWQRVCELHVSA